jgi:acyl-coenzyme A thioesterase PaaI-like protein
MPILASKGTTTFELGFTMGCWLFSFFDTLAGLFISLFLLISHDDMNVGCMEPIELSNNIN